MAKREINRRAKEVEPTETVDSGTTTVVGAEKPALPAEKQAHSKEVKPLDVTVEVKAPGVFVMQVWSGAVLLAGQGKMNKIPIVPGKPVNIRITQ